jgi:hypothetical protein
VGDAFRNAQGRLVCVCVVEGVVVVEKVEDIIGERLWTDAADCCGTCSGASAGRIQMA